jgi:hypothetical protein
MPNYKKLTDEELEKYLSGENANVGSRVWHEAKNEWEKRLRERNELREREGLEKLVNAINSLAENWKSKVFWLIVVAVVVGVAINVLTALILQKLHLTP